MIRAALLLCAGIIIAACFACTPALSPPPPPLAMVSAAAAVPPPGTGTGKQDCTAEEFAGAVRVLNAPYSPGSSTTYLLPPPSSNTAVDSKSPMWADLIAAFKAAPDGFKKRLCMTSVSIVPSSCISVDGTCGATESWALRNPNHPGERYIGLSTALWPSGGHAIPFHQYETRRLRVALDGSTLASYADTGDATDNPQETVLAALAHEYGHILWYDTFKPNGTYPSGQFNPDNPSFCSGNFYVSWGRPLTGPGQWRKFGDIDLSAGHVTNEHTSDQTSDDVKLADLYSHISGQQSSALRNDLLNLYAPSGRWASPLAALSVDEDFVETFELFVLRNANPPLQHLPLTLTVANVVVPNQGDIPGDDMSHTKVELGGKEACFAAFR